MARLTGVGAEGYTNSHWSFGAEADTPDPGQQRRFGPLSGAKLYQSSFEAVTLPIPGHGRPPPRGGTQSVTDRFMETSNMPTPGSAVRRRGLEHSR